ncbi:MAG TPA: RpiB/LacA/LacB family sugar-phosphate isomerase [Candidatus Paceibacterota bacterium]|nr:RpiB/LacA/LacB family sugar-phosphate isomerase [Candidatus Paceibacterota bacterium]
MRIYLGSDHAGFELKNKIKEYLKGLGYQVSDEGAFELDQNDDYPDFIKIVAKQVASDPEARGIIFGGSGQGEAMVANRFANVRAAVYYGGDLEIVALSRLHNNANVLSIGARFVAEQEAIDAVQRWLATQFGGEDRHIRRIYKMDNESVERPEF